MLPGPSPAAALCLLIAKSAANKADIASKPGLLEVLTALTGSSDSQVGATIEHPSPPRADLPRLRQALASETGEPMNAG